MLDFLSYIKSIYLKFKGFVWEDYVFLDFSLIDFSLGFVDLELRNLS